VGLTLSLSEQAHLRATTAVLLSPLAFEGVRRWCEAVLEAAEALFDADCSVMVVPGGRWAADSDRVSTARGTAGADRAGDPEWVVRRRGGSTVEGADETDGRARIWKSLQATSGPALPVEDVSWLRLELARRRGEASLALGYTDPKRSRFAPKEAAELMDLLLPAFQAGVEAAIQFGNRRSAIVASIDDSPQAAMLIREKGGELYRNSRLDEALGDDGEAEGVLGEIRVLAAAVASTALGDDPSDDPPSAIIRTHEVRTEKQRYRIRARWLPEGTVDRAGAVLIELQSGAPELPSIAALIEGRGLTPREAEIARLLAAGVSTKQIANRLALSPHTVRTHGEHIFAKLQIHSRKALALELLAPPTPASLARPRFPRGGPIRRGRR
jgi:DNA-binding CsgD family transcriptional regulator